MDHFSIRPLVGRYGVEFASHLLGLVFPGDRNTLRVGKVEIRIDAWTENVLAEIKTGHEAFKLQLLQLAAYEVAASQGIEVIYVFVSCRRQKSSLWEASHSREDLEAAVSKSLRRIVVADHTVVAALRDSGRIKTREYRTWGPLMVLNYGKAGLGGLLEDPVAGLEALKLNPKKYQVWAGTFQEVMFRGRAHHLELTQILKKGKSPFPRERQHNGETVVPFLFTQEKRGQGRFWFPP